jgi:hypothetical protein
MRGQMPEGQGGGLLQQLLDNWSWIAIIPDLEACSGRRADVAA